MSSAEHIESEAAGWLARRDSGQWDETQQQAFDAWLNASTAHRIAWLRLASVWDRADQLQHGALAPRRPLPRFSTWRIAAGFVLVAALGLMFALEGKRDPAQHYATAIGENRIIALSDGSRLTLNTDTKLRTAIAGETRHVWLDSGEAYFDVAHDNSRPFVVDAGGTKITVLGTRFSVRRDGERTRVLVAEGRVRVSQAGKELVLTPNGAVSATEGRIVVSQLSSARTENQLGWREGRLVLDQMTLGQAAEEFNRYNRRKLVIADPAAARMVIGGSFAPGNVEGFARLLEQGFGLHATMGADEITISR